MTQLPRWKKLYDDTWGVWLPHSILKPGDVVTVPRRDGTTSDETLKSCLSEGPTWSLWRVLAPGELLTPVVLVRNAQARRPLIRRKGEIHHLPVHRPDPPPPTDADAPWDNSEDDS